MTTDLSHRRWAPRLSEYHDGELDAAEVMACRAHLESCEVCQSDLAAIGEVAAVLRAAAREGDADAASPAAWDALVPRLAPRHAGHRWWRSPWLAAAVVTLTAGIAVSNRFGAWAPEPMQRAAQHDAATIRPAVATPRPTFDASVALLQRTLARDSAALAPETVRVLRQSLAVIDAAISDAERALIADTTNVYVTSHLAQIRARKLALLREATRLAAS